MTEVVKLIREIFLAVKLLADALVFNDEMEQKLLVLNLGMNKIGDLGVLHLANALRTNRTLISLSLIGNQIGDEGADHLVQVLKKFQLTQEEVELRRRKNFNLILQKKNAAEKSLGEKKSKEELDKRTSKTNARSTESEWKMILYFLLYAF